MAAVLLWPPEISIVCSRRSQGGAKRAMPPQISSSSCCFVLWEVVSQTRYCCSLKVKIFGPS